jgi:hypothetical protein
VSALRCCILSTASIARVVSAANPGRFVAVAPAELGYVAGREHPQQTGPLLGRGHAEPVLRAKES